MSVRRATSEVSLRAIVERADEAVGVSANGLHAMVSPAYVRMFGFDRADQLHGTPILDMIAPESRGLMKRYFRNRLDGKKAPNEYEVIAMRRDGSRFVMQVRVSVVEIDGVRHCAATLLDLTGRGQRQDEPPATGTAAGDHAARSNVPHAQVRSSTSQ